MSLQPKILKSKFARLVAPETIKCVLGDAADGYPFPKLVQKYQIDKIYGDHKKAHYALKIFIDHALQAPELVFRIFGVPKETMYRLLENRAVIERAASAEELEDVNPEGITMNDMLKLNTEHINKLTASRIIAMLEDRTLKIPFQSLSWLFAVSSDKLRLYQGESTQNIAIHSKIDVKGLNTEEIIGLLLKGREKQLASLPKKMIKTK